MKIKTIKQLEREAILSALKKLRGNRTHTAIALGISIRKLREKIREYKRLGYSVEPPRDRWVYSKR